MIEMRSSLNCSSRHLVGTGAALLCVLAVADQSQGAIRALRKTETFTTNPVWDYRNNRIAQELPPVSVEQNFGHKVSNNAGGTPGQGAGEIGGYITPAGEP